MNAKLRAFGAATLAVAIADQALKSWVLSSLEPNGREQLVGSLLSAMRLASPATSWGPFHDLPLEVLAALMLAALGLLSGLLLRAEGTDRLTGCALGLIAGAALGSALDRFYTGEVLDVLAIDFGRFALPPFNLADAAIVLGTALLLLDIAASDARHAAAAGEPAPAPHTSDPVSEQVDP